jgi:hypothetical protein
MSALFAIPLQFSPVRNLDNWNIKLSKAHDSVVELDCAAMSSP